MTTGCITTEVREVGFFSFCHIILVLKIVTLNILGLYTSGKPTNLTRIDKNQGKTIADRAELQGES